MEELSLNDIIEILKRRKKYFFTTVAVLSALSFAFAVHWSRYRSTATVQIEQSDISQSITASENNNQSDMTEALADQRISQVEQTVTSMDSLNAIITKFNLYPADRQTTPAAVLATRMRSKIKLNFIGSTLSNPAEAQKASAAQLSAIAFTLSFDYNDPQITQQVTNDLVSRFLDEDLKLRHRQAQETSAFIGAQITSLEAAMAEQGKKIADFKAANGESGPAALIFNQQAASTARLNLQNVQAQLTANEGTEGSLRSQLASIDPYSRVIAGGQVVTTPGIQLKALQGQYATLSSQYGPDHPDVVRIRHQIEALKAEIGSPSGSDDGVDTGQLQAQIKDVQTNLAAARKTEGPQNPDVVSLQRQLKSLQATLANSRRSSGTQGLHPDADNPAYLQIVSQLQATEEQHRSLLAQQASLQLEQAKYQRALAQNPGTEQQMEILSRDYDNEQLRYRELKEKKMAADMSEQLETGRKGQRLIVTIPPTLPLKTHPARVLIVAAGLLLSLLGGLASVALAEAGSTSIHSAHQVAHLTGAGPLVMVPYITTPEEIDRQRRQRPYVLAGIAALVVLGLAIFPYVLMPYDMLWNVISHKLSLS